MHVFRPCWLLCALPLLFAAGCVDPVDPRIEAIRKQFLLTSVPEGETSVSKIRKTLLEPEDDAEVVNEVSVVIRGRIHAGDLPPWETGKTAFVLTDATGHDGDEEHDPHTCPFCSRNIKDYLVKVSFRDDAGNLIDIDSREVFGVTEKQLVIITGRASIDDDGLLKVDATGLHFPGKKTPPAVATPAASTTTP